METMSAMEEEYSKLTLEASRPSAKPTRVDLDSIDREIVAQKKVALQVTSFIWKLRCIYLG